MTPLEKLHYHAERLGFDAQCPDCGSALKTFTKTTMLALNNFTTVDIKFKCGGTASYSPPHDTMPASDDEPAWINRELPGFRRRFYKCGKSRV